MILGLKENLKVLELCLAGMILGTSTEFSGELDRSKQLKHSIDLILKIMEISPQNNIDLKYSWYFLSIMTLSFAVSFIDRQVMTLLIEPIKSDLLINDTQVSLLIGFAFSIFYISMAIPIARLVDRGNRVNIISLGVFPSL